MRRYLAAERKFSRIDVFEQRATVGGLWNHCAVSVVDHGFTIPRGRPTTSPDTPIWTEGDPAAAFVSPVYDFLETNIPHTLMNYSDQKFPSGSSLFPRHAVVRQYLQDYADDIRDLITLETQVLAVEKVPGGSRGRWRVQLLNLRSRTTRSAEYDAVMVASGHYSDPFIPQIPGLAEFNERHPPGCVSHSKFYRRPDDYRGKVSRP